jgi:glutamate dehydrogenase/leucine dehydrogenase
METLLSRPPAALVGALLDAGTRRAWLAVEGRGRAARVRASTPALQALAVRLPDATAALDAHAAIFLEAGPDAGALFGAFLHRVRRGQAQGGLRHRAYDTALAFLDDGLRLSRGMSRKSALAGLWWGGGKGIIAAAGDVLRCDPERRRALYADYGRFVSSLRGSYVTAVDAGTTPTDLAHVHATTRFATCIPPEVGGSGNPSATTAGGVVCAIEAALDHLGAGSLAGKRLAMQGGGNVGSHMIELLLERGAASIVVAEIAEPQRQLLQDRFAGDPVEVRAAVPDDPAILREPCDVLVPNGLGGVLDDKTIPMLATRIVCGAANNPLVDERRHARALRARRIVYVPDYVANRMGIVQCADEHAGSLPDDPATLRHLGRDWDGAIYATTRRLLADADAEDITPLEAADRLADEAVETPHPLHGDRAERIVRHLIEGAWVRGASTKASP